VIFVVLLNNSNLLGCDTVLLVEWFLWFRGTAVPSSHDQLVISSAGRLTRKDNSPHRTLENQTVFSKDEMKNVCRQWQRAKYKRHSKS
jgi:hypothetical protein